MSKPTRAEKLRRVSELLVILPWRTDADRAILDDYAPLTEERVSELASRASLVSFVLNDKTRFGWDADFLQRWLAEIDAELEGE